MIERKVMLIDFSHLLEEEKYAERRRRFHRQAMYTQIFSLLLQDIEVGRFDDQLEVYLTHRNEVVRESALERVNIINKPKEG